MKHSFLVLSVLTLLFSCKKKDVTISTPVKVTTGIYSINEGSFGNNNSSLSFYDLKQGTTTTDLFENANGFSLGATANDILVYGSKMYIVVNVSSYVEVADANTVKEIKKIPLLNGSAPRQPRYAVGYKNKIFVSSYDGTVAVIDTSSLTIDKFIPVGSNPEEMTVCGTNLYVVNSGGLNYPDYDSTVSIIDLTSLVETKRLKVGLNPAKLTTDGSNFVFVVSRGDYGANPSKLVKIEARTNTVKQSAAMDLDNIKYYNSALYGYGFSGNVFVADTSNLSVVKTNLITDGTTLIAPSSIKIDAATGDVFVTDEKDYVNPGIVYAFDAAGKKRYSFTVGVGPVGVAIIKQ